MVAATQNPATQPAPRPQQEVAFAVNRQAVTSMFEALGYAEAKAWSPARIGKKISDLPNLEQDPTFIPLRDGLNAENRELYNKLLQAAKDQVVIDLVSSATVKTRPSVPAKPHAPAKDLDAFGLACGSQTSKAMAVINTTPKTMSDICKEAGLPRRIYNELNLQMWKGLLVKDQEGRYALSDKAVQDKAKHAAQAAAPQAATPPTTA